MVPRRKGYQPQGTQFWHFQKDLLEAGALPECCGLKVPISKLLLNPNPNVTVSGGRVPGRWLCREDGALTIGLVLLWRPQIASPLPPGEVIGLSMNQEVGSHQAWDLPVPASSTVRNELLAYEPLPGLWCFCCRHAEAGRGPKGINPPSFLEKSHQPLWSHASLPFLPLPSPARFNSVTSSVVSSSISPDTRFPEASDPGGTLRASLSHHSHGEQFCLTSSGTCIVPSYISCLGCSRIQAGKKKSEWNKKGWAF